MMSSRRTARLTWRVQQLLGHPVRAATTVALLVAVPTAFILVDELRGVLQASPATRIAFMVVLIASGAFIGATAGQVIEVLQRQAFLDTLTGLYNRRFMEAELGLMHSRAGRYGHDYSVMVFDLDGLKRVNDDHGHDAGDLAIRSFAEILRECLRGSDVAIRTGGDEFVAILPETPCRNAHVVYDRIRTKLADLRGRDPRMSIGVSGGAVGWRTGRSLEELISEADTLLIHAKKLGKDRLEVEAAAA